MFYVECSRMLRKVLWWWYGAIIESSQVQAFWIWDKRLSWRIELSWTWPWPGPELDNIFTLIVSQLQMTMIPPRPLWCTLHWNYQENNCSFSSLSLTDAGGVTDLSPLSPDVTRCNVVSCDSNDLSLDTRHWWTVDPVTARPRLSGVSVFIFTGGYYTRYHTTDTTTRNTGG